jgi:hypothetical protein
MRKFRDRDVMGIKFPSTKCSGINVALFVEPDCVEEETNDGWRIGTPLFRLVDCREV